MGDELWRETGSERMCQVMRHSFCSITKKKKSKRTSIFCFPSFNRKSTGAKRTKLPTGKCKEIPFLLPVFFLKAFCKDIRKRGLPVSLSHSLPAFPFCLASKPVYTPVICINTHAHCGTEPWKGKGQLQSKDQGSEMSVLTYSDLGREAGPLGKQTGNWYFCLGAESTHWRTDFDEIAQSCTTSQHHVNRQLPTSSPATALHALAGASPPGPRLLYTAGCTEPCCLHYPVLPHLLESEGMGSLVSPTATGKAMRGAAARENQGAQINLLQASCRLQTTS